MEQRYIIKQTNEGRGTVSYCGTCCAERALCLLRFDDAYKTLKRAYREAGKLMESGYIWGYRVTILQLTGCNDNCVVRELTLHDAELMIECGEK